MFYFASISLILIGLYAILVKRNLVKIVIGLSIMDSGINLLFITVGYIQNGTAPIFSDVFVTPEKMVDPVPQALVLTAIVIGLAVTAVALAMVIRIFNHHKTLDVKKIRSLRM